MRGAERGNRASAGVAVLAAASLWLALAAAVAVRAAQGAHGEEGVAEPTWRGSDGPFHAEVVLTEDSEALFESWNRLSLPAQRPPIVEVSTLPRGGTIDVVVLVGGCQPALTGRCDSEADFRVLAPDGSVYAQHPGADLWRRKKAPAAGVLKVGLVSLELEIEPQDPLGTYRIEVTARDVVSGRQVRLARELEVVERR